MYHDYGDYDDYDYCDDYDDLPITRFTDLPIKHGDCS